MSKTFVAMFAIMLVGTPLQADAHDLRGLMAERTALDKETRDRIDEADALRRELLDEARKNEAEGGPRLEAVVQRALRWPSSTIGVCFFDGSQVARDRVARIASQWSVGTGIRFDFGPVGNRRTCAAGQPRDIRVSFRGPGYSSYIGTIARQIPAGLQTLNLSGMDRASGFSAYEDGAVLHEFGHAIGFEHEHQSPASGCSEEFDWDALPRLLQWPVEQVRQNMARLNASSSMLYTAFDPKSIMLYAVDRQAFKDPNHAKCYIAAANNQISAVDRKSAAEIYPDFSKPQAPAAPASAPTGPVGSPAFQAKLKRLQDIATRPALR